MADTIKLKRSAVASKVPLTTDLELGEIAINTYDGKMFIKKDDGAESVVEIGSGAAWGSITGTLSSQTDLQSALDGKASSSHNHDVITLNAQTGTSYTLALADLGKLVTLSNSGAIALYVPPNSSVAFAIGSKIDIVGIGAGAVTITPGSGVTVNGTPGLKLRAQYSAATLIKIGTNTWLAIGDLAA